MSVETEPGPRPRTGRRARWAAGLLGLGLILPARLALAEPALPERVRVRQRLFMAVAEGALGVGVLVLGLALGALLVSRLGAVSTPRRWAIRGAAVLVVALVVKLLQIPILVAAAAALFAVAVS